MSGFKYDIVTLIELVESKPCIWDKTNENNKNKILRNKNWQEIFQYLEDGYEQLSEAEKKKTGEIIMAKWANIRDSFLRSLRTKTGQGAKKSYLYSEHLQFLLKIAQKDETEGNFRQAGPGDDSSEIEEFTESQHLTASSAKSTSQMQSAPSTSRSSSNEHRPKSKRQLDDIERGILLELKKGKESVEPCSHLYHPRSDQELLLLSFLPYIRDMDEPELMDLQMEVLTTIKKIKQRRVSNQHFQQQHANVPLPSPAMSHSDSYQSLDYQSPPPSNQMVQERYTTYTGANKYQQLFDDTV